MHLVIYDIFCVAGKIGDRPSGIYPQPDTVEFPTEDILLIAMERVTVLFDRYGVSKIKSKLNYTTLALRYTTVTVL